MPSSLDEKTAGIILAAGASVRMGKTKQLLPLGGGILLERVLNEALKSDLDQVALVLGHQSDEIRLVLKHILQHPKLNVVENLQYEQGISTSIRAGLTAVANYGHVMFLLADMPYIKSNLINLLLRQYLASCLPIGVIEVNEKRSHPVIFSRQIYNELQQLRGDVGARSLLSKYSDKLCLVAPDEFYDDRDIDTEDEYLELKKTLKD